MKNKWYENFIYLLFLFLVISIVLLVGVTFIGILPILILEEEISSVIKFLMNKIN